MCGQHYFEDGEIDDVKYIVDTIEDVDFVPSNENNTIPPNNFSIHKKAILKFKKGDIAKIKGDFKYDGNEYFFELRLEYKPKKYNSLHYEIKVYSNLNGSDLEPLDQKPEKKFKENLAHSIRAQFIREEILEEI